MLSSLSVASTKPAAGLALGLPIVCAAAIPLIAKLIAVAATASAFAFSVFRARHAHDPDDLYF